MRARRVLLLGACLALPALQGCATYQVWDFATHPFGHQAQDVVALQEHAPGCVTARCVLRCGREEAVHVLPREPQHLVLGPLERPPGRDARALRSLLAAQGLPRAAVAERLRLESPGIVHVVDRRGVVFTGTPNADGTQYRWEERRRLRGLADHPRRTARCVLAGLLTPLALAADAATLLFQVPWVIDLLFERGPRHPCGAAAP